MKKINAFMVKGIIKSKYVLWVSLVLIVFILLLYGINTTQSGATKKELQATFEKRLENIDFLIGRALNKKRNIGLSEEAERGLDSLLIQEEYLKTIESKLNDGDLDISSENLDYIKEYRVYESYISIPYQNKDVLHIEQRKAEILKKYNLSYTEQETPYNTALFTKKLLQLLFSPITAFLFLLIFIYKYKSDEQNRIFDFLKVKSLSNPAIYYGYLIPFLLIVVGYIILASFLSFLPPLVTGNLNTIHYPIEVVVGADTLMVPVWKWLLYIPIGWGIFVSLLLVSAICLFKQRFSMGMLLTIIALPLIMAYIISVQFGFYIVNPIHLIVSYEMHLLPMHRFVSYLVGMSVLLIIFLIASYPVFKSKGLSIKTLALNSTRKQYEPKSRWKLIQFEHLKKKRKGHVLFSLILLVGIIGGTYIFVNQQYQNLPKTYLLVIEEQQKIFVEQQMHWKVLEEEFDMEIEMLRADHEESGEETEFVSVENPYKIMIEDMDFSYHLLDDLKNEIGEKNFPEKFRETMNTIQMEGSYKELDRNLWDVTVMASEEQQRILAEEQITPWPIGHLWISHFQNPSMALDDVHYTLLKANQERNTKYGNSGLFSVYKYLNWNMMLFVMGVFILLLWTSLSDERQLNPSINFLKTKTIPFRSIYVSKWAYNLMIAYGLLVLCGGIVFLLSSLIGGIGESQYPILVYATGSYEDAFTLELSPDTTSNESADDGVFYSYGDNVNFYFESLLILILKSGMLIIAQIFFLNSLFSLVGRWVKNHYVTIIITLLLVFAGYFLASQYVSARYIFLNPFTYFDTWNVVDGWKSIVANSAAVNFINGSIILFVSGILLFIIGLLSGRRKA
ncbi:hypothetical protein H9649_05780 [Sporosarcina sp. Sa2YVA2]|uniref:ABC transporter permease n=1 Tax=Sporosarcina quadrami TaxID=2762234 RepID=A0ABR8U7S0_9BACL|nr:hypothetical protein [Sporosarcina quadrami]MBD7984082.1 hypothetical protein [Sporosarcina quadrami]